MPSLAIGLYIGEGADRVAASIDTLLAHTSRQFHLLLLGDGPDQRTRAALDSIPKWERSITLEARGTASCFDRLTRLRHADIYVLLENGAQPGPGWLDRILLALSRMPHCGIAGPSTNCADTLQSLSPVATYASGAPAQLARTTARRFGSECRTLGSNQSLADFCYVARRAVVDAIGEADQGAPLEYGWEAAHQQRARRAGFASLWVCGAYVHRALPTTPEKARARPHLVRTNIRAAPVNRPAMTVLEAPTIYSATRDFPLASCIMPTYNRRKFIPRALRCFLAQDYPSLELIVVDDGSDPIADILGDDPRIRYIRLPDKRTIGEKRNLACAEARGDIIVHWDDDDWSSHNRVSRQVESLGRPGAEISGTSIVLYYREATNTAYRFQNPAPAPIWMHALAFRKRAWRRRPFEPIQIAEDVKFLASVPPDQRVDLRVPDLYVAFIHEANAAPKDTRCAYWTTVPLEMLRAVAGDELLLRRDMPATAASADSRSKKGSHMITVAEEAALALPEFAAFNQGQQSPRMRRWELPFALFQSQLSNTMSLLDCSINPAAFQERLARLYPHVLYRHWSPIQSVEFQLRAGIPDESFDRVICVNTLEHLLRPQRQALVAAMARKLKPGGRVILTCDSYFDSFWDDPAFLASGLIRADHREVFNGFNKVTADELMRLGQTNDLTPLSGERREPVENDPTLYRQQAPFAHACMAAIFRKGPELADTNSRKIVLALLSWNTRDVTVDSLRAYLGEARMLRRLGHQPMICVCDNGSTDGAAAALRQCGPEIEYPHRFFFNATNVGNSIGRNQIIDFAREMGADYILFMDGDIEVVPFSSFAMLRYMENNGRELGCIGACSAGQTPHRQSASPNFYSIDRVETTDLVAWTQYGMFRREIFEDGIRFDENQPFAGPGWGFEDNDLAFQLKMKGYLNQRFFGMTYLHRNLRSSVRIMRELGYDARALYQQRKGYVIDKWSGVSQINEGPLRYVRTVEIRL